MRHLFIINPAAGKHTDPEQLSQAIRQVMKEYTGRYAIRLTTHRHHAENMIRTAAENSQEPLRVYVFGGDGTLNEAVNGAAGQDHVAITVCPQGSGNDFLKIFGKDQARFSNLAELLDGDVATFDLIECNNRLALNICSLGLDARVGVEMTDFKRLPLVNGSMSYILSLVSNVVEGTRDHYEVELDGERLDGCYTLFAVCNGRWYGGSFCPDPTAMPDDGKLSFLLVKGVGRLKVASLVQKYASGQGAQYPDLIRISHGRELRIRCRKLSVAQLDGEKLVSDLLSFRLSAKKIHFIYPKGASWAPEPV